MHIMKCFAAALSFALVLVSGEAMAQGPLTPMGRQSLTGLKSVAVNVAIVVTDGTNVTSDSEGLGLSWRSLATDIMLQLQDELPALTLTKDSSSAGLAAEIDLRKRMLPIPGGGEATMYAYWIRLAVVQPVRLERAPENRLWVVTWESFPDLNFVGGNRVRDLRDSLTIHVRAFIKDYLAANPAPK